jgi:hypothetical protein
MRLIQELYPIEDHSYLETEVLSGGQADLSLTSIATPFLPLHSIYHQNHRQPQLQHPHDKQGGREAARNLMTYYDLEP